VHFAPDQSIEGSLEELLMFIRVSGPGEDGYCPRYGVLGTLVVPVVDLLDR
jgi:hypothetical protein